MLSEPNNDAAVVATVPKGTTLKIVGAAEDPYLVVEYEGQTAYVHKGWLYINDEPERALESAVQEFPKRGTLIFKGALISDPVAGSRTVTEELPEGTVVTILAPAETPFLKVEFNGTAGFIAKGSLDLRDPETVRRENEAKEAAALVKAVLSGDKNAVRALLTTGADESSQAKNVGNALILAKATGQTDLVTFLEETVAKGDSTAAGETFGGDALQGGGGFWQNELVNSIFTHPSLLKTVTPQYTQDALTNKIEGTVELEVVITKGGLVGDVRVLKGLPDGLTEEAIQCVRQWSFVPAKLKGEPVDMIADINVDFKIM